MDHPNGFTESGDTGEPIDRLTAVLADQRLKDRYLVGRMPVAHNGMGEVWRARDTLLEREVVVKTVNLAAMDTDLLRRFRREALLTARLDHPGVPSVFDLGEHEGRPYLVLQWIDGLTLADLTVEQGALPVPWVYAIGAQISSVLIAAQRLGLVHRDVKPSNVILEQSGGVKVLDFGLAVMHDDKRYSRITQTGQSLGTIGYMAPEQVLGERTDHRTDLYGLGSTLFHLLTADAPFDADTTMTAVHQQLSQPPPRPSDLRPDTPEALDDLVHALLANRPEDRPASAVEVYDALAPHVGALPPIPGVVREGLDPVRAYAAAVGQRPASADSGSGPIELDPDRFDAEQAAAEAERLITSRQFRAAARLWRQLAEMHERDHGPDDSAVIGYRLRVAHAHLSLGEHERALRLVNLLEAQVGPSHGEHPQIQRLRQEIERSQPAP